MATRQPSNPTLLSQQDITAILAAHEADAREDGPIALFLQCTAILKDTSLSKNTKANCVKLLSDKLDILTPKPRQKIALEE